MIYAILAFVLLLIIGAFASKKETAEKAAPKKQGPKSIAQVYEERFNTSSPEAIEIMGRMRIFFESLQIVGRTKAEGTRNSRLEVIESHLPYLISHQNRSEWAGWCKLTIGRYSQTYIKEMINPMAVEYLQKPSSFHQPDGVARLRKH